MLTSSMSDPSVRLAMPITGLLWGINVQPGANSAIWGTSAIGGVDRKQNFSAIWGTYGIGGPMQHASTPWDSMEAGG